MKPMSSLTVCCLAGMLISLAGCSEGDIASGQARAVTCHACHGGNGMARTPDVPKIAGQSRLYLARQLRDFRDGRRENLTMSPLAASLTDDQIEDIAAYFESLDDCEEPEARD
jgi:cytochrome c553